MHRFSRSCVSLVLAGVSSASLGAQVNWTEYAYMNPAITHRMAWDGARGAVINIDEDNSGILLNVWEWRGKKWTLVETANKPPSYIYDVAYQSHSRRLLLLNFLSGADTWEWDGTDWHQLFPANAPSNRIGTIMAYDAARRRVVMFSGRYNVADTWEWDGTNWIERYPENSPPPTEFGAMAYDAARQNIVLFRGQTWTWDGVNWTRHFSATNPTVGTDAAMAYDAARQRIVMYGATNHWEWDGSNWTQRQLTTNPGPRRYHQMAYDEIAQRVVLFGGYTTGSSPGPSATYEWDGNTWQPYGPTVPRRRNGQAAAYHFSRGRVVVFGGQASFTLLNDTWEWDEEFGWVRRNPATRPTVRTDHAMAYDPARKRTVLFGGRGDGGRIENDTWEWDGTDWAQVTPAISPPPRALHAMAWDSVRQQILCFGGYNDQQVALGDTWSWDGTAWNLVDDQATRPSPRSSHAMASDVHRGRIVLAGGRLEFSGPYYNETWEWDGVRWSKRAEGGLPAVYGHRLAYDRARRRTVYYTGISFLCPDPCTLEWDGNTWQQRQTPTSPRWQSYDGIGFAYYARGAKTFLVNTSNSVSGAGTWTYASDRPAAFTPFGGGCAGSEGVPILEGAEGDLPWLGYPFTAELSSIPPGAPALMLLGGSRTTWLGSSLPLSLASIQMPGCNLLVSPDSTSAFVTAGGAATWSRNIPELSSLLGVPLHAQAVIVDPGANPAGLTMSNGAVWVFGAK